MISYMSLTILGFQFSSFFYCCSVTIVPISLPITPSFPYPSPPPTFNHSPPLSLFMGPLYMFLDDPSPYFPCSPPSPLVTVILFLISMSLVLFWSLVCFVDSTYRWDHVVFVFHHLAYFTYYNALQFHPCHHSSILHCQYFSVVISIFSFM